MSDFEAKCHLCGKSVTKRSNDEGKWLSFNIDGSSHEHLSISTSKILEAIHYKDNEDKSKTIGEMTLQELEKRIRQLASQEAAMKLGSFLHATNGFISHGFENDFIKKAITIDGVEYFVTGSLDDKNDDTVVEAKFIPSRNRFKKIRQYALDQCDIYGWITGLPKNKLVLHVIDEQKTEEESHFNNIARGEELIKNYIENNMQN